MGKDEPEKVDADVISSVPEVKDEYKPLNFPEDVFGTPDENVGWECPRCGVCWSPKVRSCECTGGLDKVRDVIEKEGA